MLLIPKADGEVRGYKVLQKILLRRFYFPWINFSLNPLRREIPLTRQSLPVFVFSLAGRVSRNSFQINELVARSMVAREVLRIVRQR
jgi:hypothetical protein